MLGRLGWSMVAPVPAIAVGATVAAHHGVVAAAFVPNVVAVAFGVTMCLAAQRAGARRAAPALAALVVVAVLGTLVATPLDGVTRWLLLGPLRLHVSSALTPYLFLGLASGTPVVRRVSLAAVVAVQAVHVMQPDAGQATVLAAALSTMVWRQVVVSRAADGGTADRVVDVSALLVVILLAALSWSRPDPLAPVPHVEEILLLAAWSGPLWVASALSSAALVLLPYVAYRHSPTSGAAAVALLTGALVTAFGAFPFPILGAGAGPVLGFYAWLTVTTTTMVDRAHRGPRDTPPFGP